MIQAREVAFLESCSRVGEREWGFRVGVEELVCVWRGNFICKMGRYDDVIGSAFGKSQLLKDLSATPYCALHYRVH